MNDLREKVERAAWAYESAAALIPIPGEGPTDVLVEAARLWLADHPADDAEPVTESWLETVGFARVEKGWGVWLERGRVYCVHRYGGLAWKLGYGEELPPMPTRGHVRRLLAMLG